MRFLDSHLLPLTCIAFGVRALRTFLRGDRFWVAMVIKIEPFRWIEVEGGRVDFVELVDRSVEVLF